LLAVILASFNIIPIIDKNYDIPTGTFTNPNSLGMFLVIPSIFIFNCLLKRNIFSFRILHFYILIILLLVTFGLILATQCRTAIVALLTAMLIILYPYFTHTRKIKKYLKVVTIVIFILSVSFLGFFLLKSKESSAKGRLLVWKVSSEVIKDNYFKGVGYGNFSVAFNDYQTKFFEKKGLDHKYGQLAGNPITAYNAFIQSWVEGGFIGFLLLCSIFLSAIAYIVKSISKGEVGAILRLFMIISIIIMCSVNFFFAEMSLMLTFVCILSAIPEKRFFLCSINKALMSTLLILLLILSFSITILVCRQAYGRFNLNQAISSRKESVDISNDYLSIAQKYIKNNEQVLYFKGLNYSKKNDLNSAAKYVSEAYQKTKRGDIAYVLGTIYLRLNEFSKAEFFLSKAMYQIPSKFAPRYALMNLYIRQKEYGKAKSMATNILNMNVKVESENVDLIKKQAEIFLQKDYK
jgi:hypothetical protein